MGIMTSAIEYIASFRSPELICPTFAEGIQGEMLHRIFVNILDSDRRELNWLNLKINWSAYEPSLTSKFQFQQFLWVSNYKF